MPQNEETTVGTDESSATNVEAERGGCVGLGWGCLPVFLGALLIVPVALF